MKPKEIESLKEIKYVYEVVYKDGSKGTIEIDPNRLRPIVNGEMCTRCGTGVEMCLYIKLYAPTIYCPILTVSGESKC